MGIWASVAVFNGRPVIPPRLSNPNAVLGIMVKKLTNPLVAGLLGVGIVSATMSLDSQFLCLSSMFTHDIVLRLFGEHRFSDKQRILLGRSLVVAIVAGGLRSWRSSRRGRFSHWASGASAAFPASSRWSSPSLYWKCVTKAGAMASIVAAAVVWVLSVRRRRLGRTKSTCSSA